jgi:hypothetical protein
MEPENKFLALANHSFKFRMYLLYKLPAAFFSGIRIREINTEKCTTSVPYKWLTQNPFRSTYFASLAMAAEMSTGVLALSNVYQRKPVVSMLVTKMEASYFKKAISTSFFTCEDGLKIVNAVNDAISSRDGKTVTVKTTGRNKDDEMIAEFLFTWSFKAKLIA